MKSTQQRNSAVLHRSLRPSGIDSGALDSYPRSACRAAIERTTGWLLQRQHANGHWCAELEGDSILQSETILLLAWLNQEHTELARRAARYLLEQQQPNGGWSLYPGGPVDISGSVKAYFALKLTGHALSDEPMRRARQAIHAHGGADAVNSFTRFYLALLGQISYDHCPAVPPELILLPDWSPVNVYRMSAWSRTILVPLSIMWAHRPVRQLPAEQSIQELMLVPPEQWPPLRSPGLAEQRGWLTWERLFRGIDRGLKWCERRGLHPLRTAALKRAEQWMLQRFEESDGLGAIYPPIVWSIVALKCLGYSDESAEMGECRKQLNALVLEDLDADTARLQPCKSPVWDTALSVRALAMAEHAEADRAIERAAEWLLDKEVTRRGDWSHQVKAEPAGWFFEYRNAFYPDVDDTIMVMMGLAESRLPDETAARARAACERARQWVLAMQNRDGGWGAFDRDNDAQFLCYVPFADHNAMIDPSTPDITARVLEALAGCDMRVGQRPVERALDYLRRTQLADGSWPGRWGVNYIYGTWQVLVGMARAGVSPHDAAVVRGANWLLAHQQPCGGWGESPASYADPATSGQGAVTASQTAWALLGLMAAGLSDHAAVINGVRYLLDNQRADGGWDEPEFTGTGFPQVFYLRYHMYPIYFPLLALATWQQHSRGSATSAPVRRNATATAGTSDASFT